MVYYTAVDNSKRSRFNVGDIRKYWFYSHPLQSVASALAHSSSEHNLTVSDCSKHALVFFGRVPTESSSPRIIMMLMMLMHSFALEITVASFGALFTGDNTPVLNRQHGVAGRSAEMRADCFSIIGYCSDLHHHLPSSLER
jgi:hypothetical protein